MTVYLIRCESGSWDTYHEWISHVFTDKQIAIDAVESINREHTKLMEEIKSEFLNSDWKNNYSEASYYGNDAMEFWEDESFSIIRSIIQENPKYKHLDSNFSEFGKATLLEVDCYDSNSFDAQLFSFSGCN